MEKIGIHHFTYETWASGSLLDLGIKTRYWDIYDNIEKIKEYAVGYCNADNLFFRHKKDCVTVMFFKDVYFWTHLTKKEFNLIKDKYV